MTIKNKLRETNIKNLTHYYLDNLIDINDLDFKNTKFDKKYIKIFLFATLDMKHHTMRKFLYYFS